MTSEYEQDYGESLRSGGPEGMPQRHDHPIVVPRVSEKGSPNTITHGGVLLGLALWAGASAGAAVAYDADPLNPIEVAAAHTLHNF